MLGRIVLVDPDREPEEHRNRLILQLCNFLYQLLGASNLRDIIELRMDRLCPEIVRFLLIHAAGIEIANLLLDRRMFSRSRNFLQNVVQNTLVVFVQLVEPSPSRLVAWDGIRLPPPTARILVEILAGINRRIERRFVEAGGSLRWLGFRLSNEA